ncbi:MAG TPA: four helix bundle protein [Anaerolineae bacterium]|nr:four helix bundle protein [Anaerolineae bacterium]
MAARPSSRIRWTSRWGEAHESENWLYKLRDAGFIDRERADEHVRTCVRIGKMLCSLMRSIRARPNYKRNSE